MRAFWSIKPLPTPPLALLPKASHVSHGGTTTTEHSHAGWVFSKCFGGHPQHVPPSGHCDPVICFHR